MSKLRRTSKVVEPLSPRERGRGEGSATAQTPRATEPSSGATRHLLPEGEGKAPRSSLPRKRESSDVASHDNWESRDFTAALSEEKPPRHGKLQARNYKATGKFPVVDQGKNDIAGWTDDETLVIDRGFPYVVFGDHTRVFKYVDSPFVLGADGTQLLKPSKEYCPRFFYYACLQLDLPSRGYNRHFTFLKEKSLPLPPKTQQQKIAAMLWKLQRAIATQDKLLKATADLKASAMQRLFTHGLRGEPLKDTEIGPMPESWEPRTIASCVTPYRFDRAAQLPASKYQIRGKWPVVDQGQAEIAGYTDDDNLLQRPDLPLIVFGDHSRTLKFVDFPFILGADGTKPLCAKESIYPKFLFHALQHLDLPSKGYSRHYKYLAESTIAIPTDEDEQRAIATALATLDRKLAHHRAKRAALHDLFQTLLHQLMTGAIRVDALDIDVSEMTEPVSSPQGAAA